ncbi:quinone oxidoreductase [Nocardioides sp. Root1257]|uniref:quinone oxidoreductase family protein n=1 Tax=unclassified Nocardioides TaxID=2615069 RepID=UPI0006F9FCA9|nr:MULTISPECIES: zinc-binding alcohol dehydrogenase family protein [unclassified Nocardioides]KQW48850.1 quinone oxidoreductase [Nocardioides sp. Root1257]KRC48025.1 quinone oxidoreductase [Nocardioides sp. Root224]
MNVNAAVVSSFDHPPRFAPFDLPAPSGQDQAVVEVLAAGLHPRVRSAATGRHYTSDGRLPLVPGIDGVGRLADGTAVYFVADDDVPGSMSERAVVDLRRTVPLPAGADLVKVAAAMNPAMSSWVALRRRVPLQPGQSVLVLGATGNAGRMAVQVAQRLGAGRVVGAGRNPEVLATLAALGADATVALTDDADATTAALAQAAAEVDVVVDYLWGEPAAATMMALLRARSDRSRALDWIQIGSVAGPTIELPSVALRSANLRLQGNGQGAVSARAYVAELPSLVDEISSGGLAVTARTEPLVDVERVWTRPDEPGVRTVLVP